MLSGATDDRVRLDGVERFDSVGDGVKARGDGHLGWEGEREVDVVMLTSGRTLRVT